MTKRSSAQRSITWLRRRLANLQPEEARHPLRMRLDVPHLPPLVISGKKLKPPEVHNLLKLLSRADTALIRTLKAFQQPQAWDPWLLAIFHEWSRQKMPKEGRWIVYALGWLGSETVVPHLIVWQRTMAAKGWRGQAQAALTALQLHGSLPAVWYLVSLWLDYPDPRLRSLLAKIAKQQNVSLHQLLTHATQAMQLQQATITAHDRRYSLRLHSIQDLIWTDEQGKRLDLTTATKATQIQVAEYQYWARVLLYYQVLTLEQHMVEGTRWTVAEFQQHYLAHPLWRYLAQQIVWGSYTTDDQLQHTCRIAEDFTLADSHDRRYHLPPTAQVGILHPLESSAAELHRWTDLFYDYGIVQPFNQLARTIYAPSAEETDNSILKIAIPQSALPLFFNPPLVSPWQQENTYWGAQRTFQRQPVACAINYDWWGETFGCRFTQAEQPITLTEVHPIILSETIYFVQQMVRKSP